MVSRAADGSSLLVPPSDTGVSRRRKPPEAVGRLRRGLWSQCALPVNPKVLRRFQLSMQYAVGKARRCGIRQLPEPLLQFAPEAA